MFSLPVRVVFFLLLTNTVCKGSVDVPCKRTNIDGATSFVCECSARYCDTVEKPAQLTSGDYAVFTSSREEARFWKETAPFDTKAEYEAVFTVDASRRYQTIKGFGGSFTDSAAINIAKLSTRTRKNLLKSYFSTSGIEYSLGRVPIHSTDFSTRIYSYDDVPLDFDLLHFKLAPEDINFKVPLLKEAQEVSKANIKLVASAWSAPSWMKDNKEMISGALIGRPGGKYFKAWAAYLLRFLQEYEKLGVPIWAMTLQNEPSSDLLPFYPWQSMALPPEDARDFVKYDLGPLLAANGYSDVRILANDDNIPFVLERSEVIFSDSNAAQYVSGMAIHWYLSDEAETYEQLDLVHEAFPDKFLLATEASTGFEFFAEAVELGSWDRGERYSWDIMQDLKHWVTGWIDWNLALDGTGGPNWAGNFVDSPIIVNASWDVFYKQPMFYHIGHFSKFVPPGSVRIDLSFSGLTELEGVAFSLPDDSTAIVITNRRDSVAGLTIHDEQQGYINTIVPPKSIQTYIYGLPDAF